MQFTLTINQSKALEWGLSAQQAMLFSFLHQVPTWADARQIGDHTWFNISKTKIVKEMPLLTDKPDTAYRVMKQLAKAGLIVMTSRDNKTYIRLTAKAISWNRLEGSENNPTPNDAGSSQGSEKNPIQVGKLSVPGSENNPTNHSTNDQTPSLAGAREATADLYGDSADLADDGQPINPATPAGQFAMTFDWKPDPEQLSAACYRRGLPADTQPTLEELADYTGHFAESSQRKSHGGWADRLAKWIAENRRNANTNTAQAPVGARHASRQGTTRQRYANLSAEEARRRAEQQSGNAERGPQGNVFDGEYAAGD
ncbi:DnaT-like ssDNA-binding domain-containing protein [Vreelandella zhanjiangensis]|uniref:DnaT-like ssDNA-binding domain-containing protein n=1 Tax=Vreelandella zhanjiangensis TaxID=1121960 RepID=UPI00402AAD94